MSRIATFVFTSLFFFGFCAHAQILPKEDEKSGLEELYDQYDQAEEEQTTKRLSEKSQKPEAEEEKNITRITDLSVLAPFADIAVIQRRFLPKTGRFEFSGSVMTTTNNQYFSNIGADLRLGYYFKEKYGVEGIYKFITSVERPITQGLVDNQRIKTDSLVQPESYYGAAFKWTPVYGKIAWFQHKIIPFDLFFTPGFGVTNTEAGGSSTTMSLGVGQIFALSKSFAVRWDFNWNYYNADVTVTTNGTATTDTKNHSDLFLGIGVSFFFPEATYR
jgi:outer membrane beta-barrel protein